MPVGDYINIMKTPFGFNFDLCQAFKQHMIHKILQSKEKLLVKKVSI